jgi:hypothetical protein
MKNILSSLNESEKKRILEMHKNASNRHYLMEQGTDDITPGPPTPVAATPTKRTDTVTTKLIGDGEMAMKGKDVIVRFSFANGVGDVRYTNTSSDGVNVKFSCQSRESGYNSSNYSATIGTGQKQSWDPNSGDVQKNKKEIQNFFIKNCNEYLTNKGVMNDKSSPYVSAEELNQVYTASDSLATASKTGGEIYTNEVKKIQGLKPLICRYYAAKQYLSPDFTNYSSSFKNILSDVNVYAVKPVNFDKLVDLGERLEAFCKS